MKSRLIVLCFLIGACSQSPPVGRGRVPGPVLQDAVRVALQVSVEEVRFLVSRGVEWDSVDHHGSTRSGECRIVVREGRMQLLQGAAVTDLGPDPVRFRGAVEWKVGADRFGGDLLVQRAPWEGVTLVNVVSLEEYLRGVVPWEIGRPGMRMPTYVASGFLGVSFTKFAAIAIIAAGIWSTAFFSAILYFGSKIVEHIDQQIWIIGVILLFLAIFLPQLWKKKHPLDVNPEEE